MALIKLTKNTTNNKEVVKKEKIEKNIKKEKKFDDPKVIYEDERGKDEYTSHYVLNDGTKKTVISSVPVNYYDEQSNTWEEIDNTLEEENDSFVTKKRKFKTEINKTSKGKGVRLSNNKCNVSWHYLGKKNSKTVVENTKLTVNKFDSNNKKRNKNTYENVDINTDLEYVLEGNNIKENIIVKEKSDSYEYNFLFELKGLKVRLSDDKESIEIYNDEKVEFMIPAPFMYDANGNRNDNVYYEIEENGMDSYIFTVVADKEWINSEERVFPVTIDPQIVVDFCKYISLKQQVRTITNNIYGEWVDFSNETPIIYKNSSSESRTVYTIHKSIINNFCEKIESVKLILTLQNTSSVPVYANGNFVVCYPGECEFILTNEYLNADGDFELILEPMAALDVRFYPLMPDISNGNYTRLEIEYILDEHLQTTTKSINLADCAVGEVNLTTGELVTSIPLVDSKNSVLGIPINLINKQDMANYSVGNNFRLNINERLEKYDSEHYIYTDSSGRKHAFRKFYYYLESGVKCYVDPSYLIVNSDGSISDRTDFSKEIRIEYKSTNNLNLVTYLDEIKNLEYIEQRTDEIKSTEESLEYYKKLLEQYVVFENDDAMLIFKKFSSLSFTKEDCEYFLSLVEEVDTRLLATKSEYLNYFSVNIQYNHNNNQIDINLEKTDDENFASIEEELMESNFFLFRQNESLETQKNDFINNQPETIKQFKKLFKEYCILSEKLEEQKRNTPVMYLTNGSYVKGYNEQGNLVIIFDNYGQYAAIEYSKNYTSNHLYNEKISSIYDKFGKHVTFIYDENGKLIEIKNVKGESVYLNYEPTIGLLNKIQSCNMNLELTFDSDKKLFTLNNLDKCLACELFYSNNKLIKINDLFKVTNLSLKTESKTSDIASTVTLEYSPNYPTTEIIITKDLVKEKYVFDEDGFNTHFYLEENGLVVEAQRFIHKPYYRGNEKQEYTGDTAKTVVINAKKETLYTSSLNDFVFIDGDSVTTTLNMFEHPLQKYTNAVAISNACTKTSTIDYTYDQEQKLIEEKETVTFSNDNKTFISYKKYTYDLYGNIIKTESYVIGDELTSGKNITENVFDENGNLIKSFSYNSLDPSTKFYNESSYNESGQVVSKLDSLGVNTTEYKYLNNLVSEEVLPNGSRFGYGYDNSGNLISITQSTDECEENSNQKVYKYGSVVGLNSNNNHVEYTYDSKRRVTKVNLNGIEGYLTATYNEEVSSGVVTKTTVNENYGSDKFVKIFNWNGKPTVIVKNNCPIVYYYYDDKQNITQILDNKLVKYKNYTYDDYDNVTKVTVVTHDNITEYSENNSYDLFGLLESKEINNCVNHLYNYSYSNDSKKNLDTITFNTDTEINLKYDINGRNKGKVISIGEDTILEEEISYLKIGDHATLIPSGIKYKGTSDNLRYSYDNMGNINKVYVNGELAVRYTYDALNRLIREDNKVLNETILISYDNNGNIINKREFNYTLKSDNYLEEILFTNTATNEGMNETNNSETSNEINRNYIDYNYVYDGDKLISIDDVLQITYDNQGRPMTYNGMNLSWDFRNLVSVGNNTFVYDGLGRRISKNNINFTYDSDNRLIKQSNGLEFFYDNTGVAGFIYQEDKYIYRKNLLGDITDIIDSNRNIIVKYVYDAWGNHKVCNPNGSENTGESFIGNLNPFRYRGYYYDEETGWFWLSSRYYSPELCRFISPDDVDYLDPSAINGLNLYAYCGNDPINYADPSGHVAISTLVLCGLALVGMGLTIGGVASDNNLMTAIGLTMVAIPALISGGMAIFSFGAWGTMAIGGVTAFAGVGTGLFASAEYQEAFTGNNWIIDTTGMSEEWYNGLMLATAAIATAGTVASMAGVTKYRNFGNSNWYNGWREMRHHYWKHGLKQMHMSNVYSYTNSAKAIIANGKYIGGAKNAYAIYVGGKKVLYVGISRANSLITTYSYRTYTIKKLIEFGLIVG